MGDINRGIAMKILVGYDGSDVGNKALVLARQHAKAFSATVYIIRSLSGGTHDKVEDIQAAETSLEYAAEVIKKEGVPCETHLMIRGLTPGEDIVNYANDVDADEIIVGIIKKSKVGKFIFGSNAQYIILEAPCPVVTVR
jgi:nucleotide-binding universal stress UspA family protein